MLGLAYAAFGCVVAKEVVPSTLLVLAVRLAGLNVVISFVGSVIVRVDHCVTITIVIVTPRGIVGISSQVGV